MNSGEIRQKFLDFFKNRDHNILKSASLITTDEKGITDNTLFNTAGMQPLIPYLLGKEHPLGNKLASSQKCIRTNDIDEVGDDTHATFFEMLGNWSFGDYFKEEAIKWSFEFLTQELNLDSKRLYVTVFEGNKNSPRDEEAFNIWKKYIPENRIYFLDEDSNWWSAGDNGPCGPDTEIFYDTTGILGDLTKEEFLNADKNQKVVEIWNNVFMEYEKKDGKVIGKLPNKNVDTGSGLERVTAVVQGKKSIFETDLFTPILDITNKISDNNKSARLIADHIKASTFLISDGVVPSNTDRGYVLRKLIRRAIYNTISKKLLRGEIVELIQSIENIYQDIYKDISLQKKEIIGVIEKESEQFSKTLEQGIKEFKKISGSNISGKDAFKLFSTYGFPIDLTKELAKENNISVDLKEYDKELKEHQDKSRTSTSGRFKGGLSGESDTELKYHTATHLLHRALQEILGPHATQKGSNITSERLRFDFSHENKMTDEEKQKVENWINKKIKKDLPVIKEEMSYNEARAKGAIGLFEDKYNETVSVYSIKDGEEIVSMELCGGPHVDRTGILGKFKIKKEEASSRGIRRIKAILE